MFFIFFTAACNKDFSDSVKFKNGLVYQPDGKELYTGIIKDTVGGKILVYEVVKGKKNGSYKTFLLNGVLSIKGKMVDNQFAGEWSYYYNSGKIESKGFFVDNKSTGTWKWFYENGGLKETGKFNNGNREGEWRSYNSKGELERIVVFNEGEIITDIRLFSPKKI